MYTYGVILFPVFSQEGLLAGYNKVIIVMTLLLLLLLLLPIWHEWLLWIQDEKGCCRYAPSDCDGGHDVHPASPTTFHYWTCKGDHDQVLAREVMIKYMQGRLLDD